MDNLGKGTPAHRAAHRRRRRRTPRAGPAEEAVLRCADGPVLGIPVDEVPDLTTLLFGPLAAGTEVSVR